MLESYVLHITKECNMQCVYCYEKDKTSTYSWTDIKKLLDDIIKYNKIFSLEFLGGEPCLRIDLIIKTVDYLKSIPDVDIQGFYITTNGTVINDDLISLLKTNANIKWYASLDGHKFMNCLRIMKTGYNSYDTVVKNYLTLKEALGNENQLGVHLVTHPYNIAYLVQGILQLKKEGIHNFAIGTVESTIIIDQDYCNTYIQQHKILSDMIKSGELTDVSISSFNWLKPKSDTRYYIKDETGKVILETYGRAENDIKDSENYKTPSAGSPLGDMIYNIREEVFLYHNQ